MVQVGVPNLVTFPTPLYFIVFLSFLFSSVHMVGIMKVGMQYHRMQSHVLVGSLSETVHMAFLHLYPISNEPFSSASGESVTFPLP